MTCARRGVSLEHRTHRPVKFQSFLLLGTSFATVEDAAHRADVRNCAQRHRPVAFATEGLRLPCPVLRLQLRNPGSLEEEPSCGAQPAQIIQLTVSLAMRAQPLQNFLTGSKTQDSRWFTAKRDVLLLLLQPTCDRFRCSGPACGTEKGTKDPFVRRIHG